MNWNDIASIVFVCVTANHLGLITAIEKTIGRIIPVVNCPKCSAWWGSVIYLIITTHDIISSLAVSFLASYTAVWLELFEGYIDTLYSKFYGTIYPATNTTDTDALDTADTVSDVSE